MEARETNLETLLNQRVQYRVPIFQRRYSWRKDEQQQLWSDVLELYDQRRLDDERAQHFLGSIVTAPEPQAPSRPTVHAVIDGQQRLTTLTLLLSALRDQLRVAGREEDAQRLTDLYLVNAYPQEPHDRYKLLPTAADREAYAQMIAGDDDRGFGSLADGHRFFVRKLAGAVDQDDNAIDPARLEDALLRGLSVVSITLGKDDSAYRVFESLNDKGLGLKQVDLIRNLYMMKLDVDDGEAAYEQVWSPMESLLAADFEAFANDFAIKDGSFVRADATYDHAKRHLDRATPDEALEALRDMRWHAELWVRLNEPEREPSADLRRALASLRRVGTDTPLPFLLKLAALKEREGLIDDQTFAEIVRAIEGFLMRRMICGVPPNQLNRLFIRLWPQVIDQGVTTADDIRRAVVATLSEPSRRWPDDDEFAERLATFPLYTDLRAEQRRHVLLRLEASFEHREPAQLDDLQIEHVIPQSLPDAWRAELGSSQADEVERIWMHTVGNLTLTGYNQQLSNHPWNRKQQLFAESHVSLSRELGAATEFGLDALKDRGAALARRAVALWPGPVRDRRRGADTVSAPGVRVSAPVPRSSSSSVVQSQREFAASALQAAKEPLNLDEWADRVRAAGFRHRVPPRHKRQLEASLSALPTQEPDTFVRVGPNLYALAEWYESAR